MLMMMMMTKSAPALLRQVRVKPAVTVHCTQSFDLGWLERLRLGGYVREEGIFYVRRAK